MLNFFWKCFPIIVRAVITAVIMKKNRTEGICINRIEKLVNILNNAQAGVLYDWSGLYILLEIEKILDYMVKHHIDPEIFMSYDLFERILYCERVDG